MRGNIFCRVGTKCLALGECGGSWRSGKSAINKIIILTWKGSEKIFEDGFFLNSCYIIEKIDFISHQTKSISLK